MLNAIAALSTPARLAGALTIALAASLAACTAATPAASPSPRDAATPGGTPIATPVLLSPSPQPSPSAQPRPTDEPTPVEGGIQHPTGSTEVILRMEQGGGFVPLGFMVTQAPDFTLYGDGTFIIKPLEDPDLPVGWDVAQPRFLQGHLDESTVQELLAYALNQGRLAAARDNYTDDTIADASTTIFTVNAGGISKTVSVYALSEITDGQKDPVDRAAFHDLAQLLRSFEDRARAGELGEVVLYEPSHYRVVLLEVHGEVAAEPMAWPWDHVTPEDFEETDEFRFPNTTLPAEDVALLTELPSGGHPGIAVEHDGTIWQLGIRPLLPDEEPES